MAVLTGTSGDDTLFGTDAKDTLHGGDGDDYLVGGKAADLLAGDAGDDRLNSGESDGADTIDGGAGIDTAYILRFFSTSGINLSVADNLAGTVILADGSQVLNIEQLIVFGSLDAADTLAGGSLADEFYGRGGNDSLSGLGGADILAGDDGSDTLGGGNGADVLMGGAGSDSLSGGAGDDTLYMSDDDQFPSDDGSAETLDGGSGIDTAYIYDFTTGVAIRFAVSANLHGAVTLPDGSSIANIERVALSGGTADDSLAGGALQDTLDGYVGNDTLLGWGGDDVLSDSEGNDSLFGGAGNDQLLSGDSFHYLSGPSMLDGGPGTDSASINRAFTGSAIVFSIAANLQGTVTLPDGTEISNIESVSFWGDNLGGDVLAGGALSDSLNGNGGNDTLLGGGGADGLGGGDSNDSLGGGAGGDYIDGDYGNDTVNGGAGNDTLSGGYGGYVDVLKGGSGDDSYLLYDIYDSGDTLTEGANQGIDSVLSASSATLGANFENLTLVGVIGSNGAGNGRANALTGDASNNMLDGRGGKDTLDGREANDTLIGGAGADKFTFTTAPATDTNCDLVQGFEPGVDAIRLDDGVFNAFDASASNALAEAQFHSAPGATAAHDADDRIIYDESSGALYYDADGSLADGVDPVRFALLGTNAHPQLTYSDFVII